MEIIEAQSSLTEVSTPKVRYPLSQAVQRTVPKNALSDGGSEKQPIQLFLLSLAPNYFKLCAHADKRVGPGKQAAKICICKACCSARGLRNTPLKYQTRLHNHVKKQRHTLFVE